MTLICLYKTDPARYFIWNNTRTGMERLMIIIVSWACIALVTTGPLSHGGFVNVITIDGL